MSALFDISSDTIAPYSGMVVEGIWKDTIKQYPDMCLEGLSKPTDNFSQYSGVSAEIRIVYLANTCIGRYRHTNLKNP
jgi:hypothetical protein